MESVKMQAFKVFDLLSEQEQSLVYELMIRLAPDDMATQDDLAAHAAAMEEYRRGETVAHEDIDWD
jgi:hypothetical protein